MQYRIVQYSTVQRHLSVTLQVRGGAVFTTLLLLVTALLAGRLTYMLHR